MQNEGPLDEVSRSLVRNWVPCEEIEHQGPWEVTCTVAIRQPELSLLGLGVALSVHPMPAPARVVHKYRAKSEYSSEYKRKASALLLRRCSVKPPGRPRGPTGVG